MEYGLIFHGTHTGKYYCKNMRYRINIYITRYTLSMRIVLVTAFFYSVVIITFIEMAKMVEIINELVSVQLSE